jgi:hypothetical protein
MDATSFLDRLLELLGRAWGEKRVGLEGAKKQKQQRSLDSRGRLLSHQEPGYRPPRMVGNEIRRAGHLKRSFPIDEHCKKCVVRETLTITFIMDATPSCVL